MNDKQAETFYFIKKHDKASYDFFLVAEDVLKIVKKCSLQYVSHTLLAITTNQSVYSIAEIKVSFDSDKTTGSCIYEDSNDANLASALDMVFLHLESELVIEFTLLHLLSFQKTSPTRYRSLDIVIGGPFLNVEDDMFEVFPAVSGLCESLYGMNSSKSLTQAPHILGDPHETLWLEALFSHPRWFAQYELQNLIVPGMSVAELVQLKMLLTRDSLKAEDQGDRHKPDPIFILSITVELLELISFPPLFLSFKKRFQEGKKKLFSRPLLNHECHQKIIPEPPTQDGSLYTFHILPSLLDCVVPSVWPTAFSNKFTRTYALKITLCVSSEEKNVVQRLEVTMDVNVAKADESTFLGILQRKRKKMDHKNDIVQLKDRTSRVPIPNFKPEEMSEPTKWLQRSKIELNFWLCMAFFTDSTVYRVETYGSTKDFSCLYSFDESYTTSGTTFESTGPAALAYTRCFVERGQLQLWSRLLNDFPRRFNLGLISDPPYYMGVGVFDEVACDTFILNCLPESYNKREVWDLRKKLLPGMKISDIMRSSLRISSLTHVFGDHSLLVPTIVIEEISITLVKKTKSFAQLAEGFVSTDVTITEYDLGKTTLTEPIEWTEMSTGEFSYDIPQSVFECEVPQLEPTEYSLQSYVLYKLRLDIDVSWDNGQSGVGASLLFRIDVAASPAELLEKSWSLTPVYREEL